jgi:fructose-bisphosphate aldolase class I
MREMTDLVSVARSLVAPGKGILAADESVGSATKRLSDYGIPAGEEMRRQFRNLFLNTRGAEEYLSGVILFSETLLQKGNNGQLFPESLLAQGIFPGIKVDLGTEPINPASKELITQGLLDLAERLGQYKYQGALFTKWRAVITIEGDELPTANAILENAKRLAQYAKLVQTAGLVPILEPEVLYTGRHSRQRSRAVIKETLGALFSVLEEQSVDLGGILLKTAMALSGKESGRHDTPEEVATDTVEVLIESVPRQVAGIVFLSGGQTPDQATDNLRAIVRKGQELAAPWPMTFSYARALQEESLALWKGREENVEAARMAYLSRLGKVSLASQGL